MKNADMPAMPIAIEMSVAEWKNAIVCGLDVQWTETYPGLSKREHLAAMAMQGMLANERYVIADDKTLEIVKTLSYRMADLMLEE